MKKAKNGKMSLETVIPFRRKSEPRPQFLVQHPKIRGRVPLAEIAPLSLSRPTLLVLPSINSANGNIDGIRDNIDRILPAIEPQIAEEIIIAAPFYPSFGDTISMIKKTQHNPYDHVSPFITNIFDQILLPALSPQAIRTPSGNIEGKRHPQSEFATTLKTLSTLTIFGYSTGSIAAQNLCNAMNQAMDQLEYSREDKARAFQAISCITAADISRQHSQRPNKYQDFSGVRFAGKYDLTRDLVAAFAHATPKTLIGQFLTASHPNHFKSITTTTKDWQDQVHQNNNDRPPNPDAELYQPLLRSQWLSALAARIKPINHALELYLSDEYLTNLLNAALEKSIRLDRGPKPPFPNTPKPKPPKIIEPDCLPSVA